MNTNFPEQPSYPDDIRRKVDALLLLATNAEKIMPEEMLTMWLDLLSKVNADIVEASVRLLILRYPYKLIPPFSEMAQAVKEVLGESESQVELMAQAEWTLLIKAITEYGSWKYPKLHKTTQLVVDQMGGWLTICSWDLRNLELKRKDFTKYWKQSHGLEDALLSGALGVQNQHLTGKSFQLALSCPDGDNQLAPGSISHDKD